MVDTKLGLRVKALRKQRGWSQQELAKCSGLTRSAISDIETGVKTYLSKSQRKGLAKVMSISIEELTRLEAQ